MSDKSKRKTQKKVHFRRCIIIGCGSTSRNSTRDVSFHTLPKATLGWVRTNCAQHLPTGVNLCRVFICSRHYHPSYLNVTPAPGARRLLTTNAIPTVFPPFSDETSRNAIRSEVLNERHETKGNSSSSSTSDDFESAIIPPLTAAPTSASGSEVSSSSSSESVTDSGPEVPPEEEEEEEEQQQQQTTLYLKGTTTKPRPPAPASSAPETDSPPVIDELRLAVEQISLQCDRVVAVLDKLDHRKIPLELLIPLQNLVEKIQLAPQRKRSLVEASIEIFEDDIKIREELEFRAAEGDNDENTENVIVDTFSPPSENSQHVPIEIHMTSDMCFEEIDFRHH